jgi:ADP-ribosylglycohydrolase
MTSTSADALRGAVYGHLVADAIGVPYEFTSPDPARVVELRGHGSHQQPAGTWSDDGALMLALLDSLVSVGWDTDDQARRILAWVDDGAYTPDGDGLFDIGNATMHAVHRLKRGISPTDAGGPPDSDEQGNGSLMRILPTALVEAPADDAELAERAHLASRVTHGALPCQVACGLYVFVARAVVDAPDAEPETLLATAVERLRNAYHAHPDHAMELETLLVHRSRLNKPGGGWVLDSFWSAWEAFVESASYREAIERCVRLGHDTDTTGAIAGGLAGIRWGVEGIPGEWLEGLRGRELVDRIVSRIP